MKSEKGAHLGGLVQMWVWAGIWPSQQHSRDQGTAG